MLLSTRSRAHAVALGVGATLCAIAFSLPHPIGMGFSAALCVVLLLGLAESWHRLQRLQDQLSLALVTDVSTGVLNRRAYSEATGSASSVEVIVVVEEVEDLTIEYGCSTAEDILTHVANVIQASVREEDLVGKLAEDRFGVLLQDVELEVAQRICARIEFNVSTTPFSNGRSIIELCVHADIEPTQLEQNAAA